MKARKLAKKVPNLIGDGVHNQPYDSGTVSMIIFRNMIVNYGCIRNLIELACVFLHKDKT